jgi:disulfide bond formation protein DsbB
MARLTPRPAPEWVALAAGAAALVIVHLAQSAGLVPCALCYLERWPYRLAIVLALAALAWPAARLTLRPLLLAAFLAAAALAFIHVGVEAQWWKSPLPECAAPILRTGSIRDLLASMPARPAKPCDDPTYLIPDLPLSMAQANLLYALASAAIVAICTPWTRTPWTRTPP